MKTYNGPHSPQVGPFEEQTRVRVHNLIPSLWQHANIGSEEREDQATEFTTILPASSLPAPTYSQYPLRRSVFPREQRQMKPTKPASLTNYSGLVLPLFLLVSGSFWQFLKPKRPTSSLGKWGSRPALREQPAKAVSSQAQGWEQKQKTEQKGHKDGKSHAGIENGSNRDREHPSPNTECLRLLDGSCHPGTLEGSHKGGKQFK